MSEFSFSSKKSHFSTLLLSDLFLFFSFILSHPLYFFYFIFFFPYLFKLLSFLSPLFVTTFLLLSVFLTFSPNLAYQRLATEFAESKVSFLLGTYQAVVERLKSRVEEAEDEEFDQFEEFEAYKIVFAASDFDIGVNSVPDSALEAKENGSATEQVEANKSSVDRDYDLSANEVSTDSATDEVEENKSSVDQDYDLSANEVSTDENSATDEVQVNKSSVHEDHTLSVTKVLTDENSAVNPRSECSQLIAEVKKLSAFLHEEEDDFEEFGTPKGEKEGKELSESFKKVEERKEEVYPKSRLGYKLREGSKISDGDSGEYLPRVNSWSPLNGGDYPPKIIDNSPSMRSDLGSFGSMRKEKEWRRTLACKLFEERHNVDGGEGMDLLWETYETDSMKLQARSKTKKEKKLKYDDGNKEAEEGGEGEEEEEIDGQLCCLQALKFSAGKMNLGMGRPNLVKISKAFKGIGWLHHVSKKKSCH